MNTEIEQFKAFGSKHKPWLTKTPNFGDMPILETLDLEGCVNLEEVHPSLGHCRMLTSLSLDGCCKLKKLPKFVCMESLEDLDLSGCTSLEEFPEIRGDTRHLSILDLGSPWIYKKLNPPSLSGLRELRLADCEILESIPDTIRNLSISGCNKLATLPNSLFESQQLDFLYIDRCSGLVKLPISLGVQKNLYRLEIERCENLKSLPNLEELSADYHLALKSIRDLVINSFKLDRLGISNRGAVSSEQVNVFLQHFLRTCIQCDFRRRDSFLILFPGVRIPELFDYDWFINQKRISIDLNPSWYTDKFLGFLISYGPAGQYTGLEATYIGLQI